MKELPTSDRKSISGQWNPLVAQLEGAAAMGAACSHLVLQSLVAQSAKVIEKLAFDNEQLTIQLEAELKRRQDECND